MGCFDLLGVLMEMLCPECLTPLVSQDDSIAICLTHGGAFRILYTRYTVAPPPPAQLAPAEAAAAEAGQEPVAALDGTAVATVVEPAADEAVVADISIRESEEDAAPVAEEALHSEPEVAPELAVEVSVEEMLAPEAGDPTDVKDVPVEPSPVIETDDFDIDHIPELEPQIEPDPVADAPAEFVDQTEMSNKSPSALEAAVESLAERSPDLDFDEQPFVADAGAAPVPPPLPAAAPLEAPKAEPEPIAPAAVIPAPPPRPVLSKNKTRAQPRSEAPATRLPPTDPFEVASPSTKPLPAAAFGGGVEIPNPARAGPGTRSKPAARANRPAVAPKLPPLPPPPPATPVWDGPRPVREAPTPAAAPQSPNELKPRKLGNCKIHRNVPAIAACRSCGAGVCSTCDTLIADKIHQCPACKAAKLDALAAGRKKMAKWSVGLALWSAVGLALLASGATRGFAGTESALDVVILVLTVVWIFSQIAALALAIISYSGKGKNSRMVWTALILNVLLIAAWVLPFMRLLKLGKE